MTSSVQQKTVDRRVATALWKAVGGFSFLVSLSIIAAISSEKVGPDLLKLIDTNPYAITLLGIPVLSGVLIAVGVIGRVHSLAVQSLRQNWVSRIPAIVEGISESSLGLPVNLTILIAFLFVPWIALGAANVKFFHGTYYYATDANKGCDEKNMSGSCVKVGAGWTHFTPTYGIGSLTNTHYRYEADKTYVPVLTPAALLGISFVASIFAGRFLVSLFTHIRD